MYSWAKDLFPINRSLTGEGVRETLQYFKQIIPELEIKEVSTGYRAFDWTVPEEWEINNAYIENEHGEKIVDFKSNNLHVVGYSEPVDKWLTLEELNGHLYSLPEQPDAIPYVTSYYKKTVGVLSCTRSTTIFSSRKISCCHRFKFQEWRFKLC